MIYTKTPEKRKKIGSSTDIDSPYPGELIHNDVLHSDPLKVSDHVNETRQILRNVLEGDYAAISKRLATGQSMMSVREPRSGSSIAHLAARCGDKAILKLLLRKYSDYTKMSNNNGRTAVHEAAEHGKFVCLTYLLQHGAVCKSRDRTGVTPLMLSAQKGHIQTLRRLALSDPETMMCTDINGYTALHHASLAGQEASVRWLVEFGADDQAKDNDGNTAMHHAVTNNNLKCAIWLQHFSNCDVRQINNRGYNSCHIAAQNGHLCLLRWLLSNQLASPNEPGGKDGSTPVHVAAAHGQLESLRCLKSHGGNMHKKNFSDKSPKDIAASKKRTDCVRYLETMKKPKSEKSQKRASSLTRIVQALSISGTEEKTPKSTPKSGGSFSKSKRKAKGDFDKCLSDTESDHFPSWPCEKLNFNKTLPPRAPNDKQSRPRSNSQEDDRRSVYSNGSGGNGPPPKQNGWTASNGTGTLSKSLSSNEISEKSPNGTAGFDIMKVLRDEKKRQARLRAADQDDEMSLRSGGSYNGSGSRLQTFSFEGTLDRRSLDRSSHGSTGFVPTPPPRSAGYAPTPPPRSISIDSGARNSANSADFDMRLSSPQSPGHEVVSVSDRSSLALSDSSNESSRQFMFPRGTPCPVHQPLATSPARICAGDFKKVFSERQAARVNTRCTCRNSTELLLRDIPEQHSQRHIAVSRSSNGSDYALSPTGSGGSGVTTLRRQASELNRLNLDTFKASWGTKTLSQNQRPSSGGSSSLQATSPQNFGLSSGQLHGMPCGEYVEKCGRDGTTFRTSTNLSDICKL